MSSWVVGLCCGGGGVWGPLGACGAGRCAVDREQAVGAPSVAGSEGQGAWWGRLCCQSPPLVYDQDGTIKALLDLDGGAGVAGSAVIRQYLYGGAVEADGVVVGHSAAVLEAQYRIEGEVGRELAVGGVELSRDDCELPVEAWQEVGEHPVGLLDSSGSGEAQLRDQPVLKGAPDALYAALGLGGVSQDESSSSSRALANCVRSRLPRSCSSRVSGCLEERWKMPCLSL